MSEEAAVLEKPSLSVDDRSEMDGMPDIGSLIEKDLNNPLGIDPPQNAPTPTEPPAPSDKPKTPEIAKEGAEKPIQKDASPVKKNKWDIDPLKKAVEPPKEGEILKDEKAPQTTEDDKSPQKLAWDTLKTKADRLDKEILPAYEALQKEHEDLKKKIVSDEERGELETMRQRYAEDLLENDAGFQNEVTRPIQGALATMQEVAEGAGLNETQTQALANAVRERSDVKRSLAIRKIIAGGTQQENGEAVPLGDEQIATLASLAIDSANDLHKRHWPKEVEYRSKARDISNAIKGRETQVGQAEKQKQEQEYQQAHKEIYGTLSSNLAPLFEDKEVADAVQNSKKPETAMEMAYATQAGEILPAAAKYILKITKERDEAIASLKARGNANPTSADTVAPQAKAEDDQGVDLRSAMMADFRGR